jgi:hypothetical protein
MNRRALKNQNRHLAHRLAPTISKYLAANARVHQDVIYSYQITIELFVVDLMSAHLILDHSWPHRERWLDGLCEEYSWERKNGAIYGTGALFWGHRPDVSREITGLGFGVVLKLCSRHGVEYQFKYGNDEVRSYSSQRWCRLDSRV